MELPAAGKPQVIEQPITVSSLGRTTGRRRGGYSLAWSADPAGFLSLRNTAWRPLASVAALICGMSPILPTLAQVEGGRDAALEQLVRQLDADAADERDQAEQELLQMAVDGDAESLLAKLPTPDDRMPQEVQTRLARVRRKIGRQIAEQAASGSRVSLSASETPLADVLAAIQEQTGNRLVDHRAQFGEQAPEVMVNAEIENELFWPALDKLLDQSGLMPYNFSDEEELALVNQSPGGRPRSAGAAYAGPFRIEATQITARRSLSQPDQNRLQIELNIAWEPRLKPLAISQPAAEINAVGDSGQPIPLANPETMFDVEIAPGSHATDMTVSWMLPDRKVHKLASVAARFSALVPGRIAEMRFDDLDGGAGQQQEAGGVTVSLNRVVERQGIWEFHMRLRMEGNETGLESHRGWVFGNLTFLENYQGETIDHAGFETTLANDNEVGFVYLFEIPDDIGNYTWVYRTPAAIMRVPVEYELKDIPLP